MMHRFVADNVQYGTGKVAAPVKEGDYIEFEAEQKGQYWNADPRTIKQLAKPTVPSNVEVAPKRTWVPDTDRQDSIIYQSSRKDSIETVKLLIESNALDFGKAKTVAQKVELVEMYIDKFTVRYFDDTKRLAPPEHPVEEAKAQTPKPAELFPDDDIPF